MCYHIGIEDLAANALIELLKQQDDKRFVSYRKLERYGSAVVQLLKDQKEKVVLILSRDATTTFFHDYSRFFEEKEKNGEKGVQLREGFEKEDLIREFRGCLALDLLLAFIDKHSISALGGVQ